MVRRRSSEGLVAYVPSGLVKNGASEFERVTPNQHVWWSDDFSPVSERRLLQTARSETPIYSGFVLSEESRQERHDAVTGSIIAPDYRFSPCHDQTAVATSSNKKR
jgi:hypothetical protein